MLFVISLTYQDGRVPDSLYMREHIILQCNVGIEVVAAIDEAQLIGAGEGGEADSCGNYFLSLLYRSISLYLYTTDYGKTLHTEVTFLHSNATFNFSSGFPGAARPQPQPRVLTGRSLLSHCQTCKPIILFSDLPILL